MRTFIIAAAAAALLAGPALAASKKAPSAAPAATPAAAPTTKPAAKPAKKERSAAQIANDNRMKACGAEWRALKPEAKKGKTWTQFLKTCRAKA